MPDMRGGTEMADTCSAAANVGMRGRRKTDDVGRTQTRGTKECMPAKRGMFHKYTIHEDMRAHIYRLSSTRRMSLFISSPKASMGNRLCKTFISHINPSKHSLPPTSHLLATRSTNRNSSKFPLHRHTQPTTRAARTAHGSPCIQTDTLNRRSRPASRRSTARTSPGAMQT